jgi:acyl-CoA thioester hydrolase
MTVTGRKAAPPLSGRTIEVPVRFAECDSYGVVWHGHYALYLEQAREAMTAQFGFTASRSLALGYRVPITRMEVRYRRPVLADTTVRVTARLRAPEAALLLVDYEIRDTAGELLASAATEQVVVKEDGELLVSLPAALATLVKKILENQDGSPLTADS